MYTVNRRPRRQWTCQRADSKIFAVKHLHRSERTGADLENRARPRRHARERKLAAHAPRHTERIADGGRYAAADLRNGAFITALPPLPSVITLETSFTGTMRGRAFPPRW